jgi:hypothetical protein
MTESLKSPASLKQSDPGVWMALGLVWEIGYIIAIPAFVFGFGGAYLDKYLGLSPLLMLAGLLLALIVSGFAIYHKVRKVIR